MHLWRLAWVRSIMLLLLLAHLVLKVLLLLLVRLHHHLRHLGRRRTVLLMVGVGRVQGERRVLRGAGVVRERMVKRDRR